MRSPRMRHNDLIASAVILPLLALIGVGVFLMGRAGSTAELPPLPGTAATSGFAAPATLGDYALDSVRDYDEETLYEYINGQAPRFVQFGFQSLRVAEYRAGKSAPLTVDLYDMGRRRNAYGIWADGRSPEVEPAALGNDGYTSGNLAAFWKSRYYVRILALTDDDAADKVQAVAGQLASSIEDSATQLAEFDAFPKDGLDANSLTFSREAAFGLAHLNNTFWAHYAMGDAGFRLFFLEAESAEAASKTLALHVAFLKSAGGTVEELTLPSGEKAVWGQEKYIGPNLLIAKGKIMAGCLGLGDSQAAQGVTLALLQSAQEALGKANE